jgi:hypothetical protein
MVRENALIDAYERYCEHCARAAAAKGQTKQSEERKTDPDNREQDTGSTFYIPLNILRAGEAVESFTSGESEPLEAEEKCIELIDRRTYVNSRTV